MYKAECISKLFSFIKDMNNENSNCNLIYREGQMSNLSDDPEY